MLSDMLLYSTSGLNSRRRSCWQGQPGIAENLETKFHHAFLVLLRLMRLLQILILVQPAQLLEQLQQSLYHVS